MKATVKRAWPFVLLIVVLYTLFMQHFCLALPNSEGTIKNQQQAAALDPLDAKPKDVVDRAENKSNAIGQSDEQTIKPTESNKGGEIKTEAERFQSSKNSNEQKNNLEVYVSEITDFYELIITLLLGIIGFTLVLAFIYISFTSKKQSEDMANEALDSKSFGIHLKDLIDRKFAEFKNSDELAEVISDLPDLKDKIAFLEERITDQAYEKIEEGRTEEIANGSN